MARKEELLEQRRALAAAQGLALRHLPSLAIKLENDRKPEWTSIGRAESINENIDKARRSKGNL